MFQTDYTPNGPALSSINDIIFTNTAITGAHHSGDAYNAKSAMASGPTRCRNPGRVRR
jgi:hypothetical protein